MAQFIYTMNRVGKVVPPKRIILRDISLSFFPGAKIGVLGLNGSGKSTLLRIMAGMDKEIEGEARAQAGIKVGYLPQEPVLDENKTVRQTVGEGVGEVQSLDRPLQRHQRPLRRAHVRRGDEQGARGAGEAAGQDRRGGWMGARAQARDRGRLAAAAALGRRHRQALGRREAPRRAVPAAPLEARHAAARRAHQPSRCRIGGMARAVSRGISEHRHRGHPRPLFPRQRRRVDSRARPRARHSVAGQLLLVARAEGAATRARGARSRTRSPRP